VGKARALVTGATGFVGANLARRLLEDGHEVHLLVRPGHASWRLEGIRRALELHEAELADADGVAAVLRRVRPEWIFHLAAYGAYSSQQDVRRTIETNVIGTVNLVEAGLRAGFAAFVNAGSSSEYGFKDHAPSEREWLEPNSHYAVSKAAATHLCRYTAQTRGVPIRTLRLYSVYGPWEEPARLMPTLAARGLRGELPPLVDPGIARDYVYADDVSDAFVRAAATSGQEAGAVYNVGSGVQTALGEVVEVARRVLGVAAEPSWGTMEARRWDTSTWVSDPRAIERALGWRAQRTFEDGFRRLVEWLRSEPSLLRRYQLPIEGAP
jgi:dolichol-phosphate mannosyltransferase